METPPACSLWRFRSHVDRAAGNAANRPRSSERRPPEIRHKFDPSGTLPRPAETRALAFTGRDGERRQRIPLRRLRPDVGQAAWQPADHSARRPSWGDRGRLPRLLRLLAVPLPTTELDRGQVASWGQTPAAT